MAECNLPPPSYESVVQPDVRLTFFDFWPKCLDRSDKIKRAPFEQFRLLIARANEFLLTRSDIILKNVQTISKKCANLSNVYNGCLYYRYGDSHAAIVYGLRLWFAIDPSFKPSAPLQLQYIDLKPRNLNSSHEYVSYPRLDEVIKEFNEGLRTRPLEGSVVSIDTVTLKIDKEIWKHLDGNISTEQTSWPDIYKQHLFQFIRVFYLIGPPKYEYVGIQDFVPHKTCGRGVFHGTPEYTSYSSMLPALQTWLRNDTRKTIKNINTVETIYVSSTESGESGHNLFTTYPYFYKIYGKERVRFMRVGYVVPQDPTVNPQNNHYPGLSYRTFVPGYLGGSDTTKYQSMIQLMKYAISWLNATRANVICAEFCGPFHHDYIKNGDSRAESSTLDGEWYWQRSGNSTHLVPYKFIYFIRVYLDRYYPEPAEGSLVEVPSQYDGECRIL
ncbi:uncharacterized protein LOC141900365 [Tubulanus polymorphus]|uniref:uncharacterized protein LOC141900365 n=1 Tax=Tubulanus polymorphus TaxID=672921 RepID=UPI003DA38F01